MITLSVLSETTSFNEVKVVVSSPSRTLSTSSLSTSERTDVKTCTYEMIAEGHVRDDS